ncbi:High mobility group [Chlorella sorokiniana]|uniref:High mobility group n=1 Tax=Chlorella sorokiniana TaxID=3076 RepID=A0A2P6TYT0_CHLSO|nr:High mobility group [Chlorella sorokiniana]|eukprot:PRW59222.1 High mobility group [Chlorella sorokiniana]
MPCTGVSTKKILAAKQAAMSQSVEAELAALEAEVQEPVAVDEDVDAALEALMGEVEEEPAAEAEEALPAEAPLAMTQPAADEPAEEAPAATQPIATQPIATQPAAAEPATQPAAAPQPAPEPAAEPASAKKPLLKRKPMLSVAKKSAKGRTAPEEPTPEPAAEQEEPAQEAAAEEPGAAKPAPKPAKKLGLAKPAAKPAAAAGAAAPSAPQAKAPVTKPKAAAAAAAGEGSGEQPAAKAPKRPCTAYFHFMSAKRAEVKAANPELDNKGLVKRLAEMWKELGGDDKQSHEARTAGCCRAGAPAAADKGRYQAELAAAGPLAVKEKKPRAKSAYQLYCDSRMADLKASNPKAGMPERSKLLAAEWAALSDEAKIPFQEQAKELKAQLKVEPAAAADGGEAAAAAKPQKKRKVSSAGGAGGKRSKGTAGKKVEQEAPEVDDDELMADVPAAESEEEEGDAEAERMAVDWEAAPAVCILSETRGGKFVVMRQGVGISEYGLVDAAAVRQQRLGGGDGSCPVSLEMLAEYEEFHRTFKTEVHYHSEAGSLELEDLPSNSLLDSCLFLGLMREPGYVLEKKGKNDVDIKVPLLATCQLVQRMVVAERQRLAGEMAALRKENAHLRAAAPGAAAVAEQ